MPPYGGWKSGCGRNSPGKGGRQDSTINLPLSWGSRPTPGTPGGGFHICLTGCKERESISHWPTPIHLPTPQDNLGENHGPSLQERVTGRNWDAPPPLKGSPSKYLPPPQTGTSVWPWWVHPKRQSYGGKIGMWKSCDRAEGMRRLDIYDWGWTASSIPSAPISAPWRTNFSLKEDMDGEEAEFCVGIRSPEVRRCAHKFYVIVICVNVCQR